VHIPSVVAGLLLKLSGSKHVGKVAVGSPADRYNSYTTSSLQ